MIIAQTLKRPQIDAKTEVSFSKPEPDMIATMRDKLSVDSETQMSRHKEIEQHDDEKPKHY